MKLVPYLKLMRISALPTCWSNVLTAFWLCNGSYSYLGLLLLVSSCFYLAGMILNDVYDVKIDAVERPERPIPSGQISLPKARILGFVLLLFGLFTPYPSAGPIPSGKIYAFFLFLAIWGYNLGLKRIPLIGPITMGLCRLINIFMVYSTSVDAREGMVVYGMAYAGFVFVYITAITILAGYEVESLFVRKLVGIGLSSIILIDAVWCFAFVGLVPGLIVLALYPVPLLLRRVVSMT